MLNGKKTINIQTVPAAHKLLRFNILFAYVFDAVSGGKGKLQRLVAPVFEECSIAKQVDLFCVV